MSANTSNNGAAPNAKEYADVTEQDLAVALLSIRGPCRDISDAYLTCVATAGMGRCRHLRAHTKDCTDQTALMSHMRLTQIANTQFEKVESEAEKMKLASRLVNQQISEAVRYAQQG